MLPSFEVFGLTIPMYGVMVTLGYLLGAAVVSIFPPDKKIPREDLFYAACFGAIGLVGGAKILSIIQSLPFIVKYY